MVLRSVLVGFPAGAYARAVSENYKMNLLKRNFIKSFADELANLNGTEFEYLCKPLLGVLLGEDVEHKGHNLYGKPVGYTADFLADNFNVIGQCGTEPGYFDDLGKPIKDIDRAIANHPNSETIYLFANQRGSGGKLTLLNSEIKKKKYGKTIETYDSEKCANAVLNNLNATTRIEEILDYLPKTKELYKVLPQTNKLPSFKSQYFSRSEEKEILDIIDKQDCVQVYGISGIGKTELTISIANNLKAQFETVIWLDGDLLEKESVNFSSVHISRFNSRINLEFLLQRHKTLLIVDNLNQNVTSFFNDFKKHNESNSKCIISSLQRNVDRDQSYDLGFLNLELAKKILQSTKPQPSDKEIDAILTYVQGYPLVLKLIKSAVETNDFAWGDIVNEIDTLKDFIDDRNKRLSDRIIEKYLNTFDKELTLIHILDNRILSRNFISNALGKVGVDSLQKRSLITVQDSYYFNIHQLILDAIKQNTNVERFQELYEDKLFEYLSEFNEIKSLDYFKFLLNHRDYLDRTYDPAPRNPDLKKVILYAFIQSTDYFSNPEWVVSELDMLDLEPAKSYIDLLLYIEQQEIRIFQLKDKDEDYTKACLEKAQTLENILVEVAEQNSKRVLLHHIGKFYLKGKDLANAIKHFNLVLGIDSNADYSLLQLARIDIQEKRFDDAEEKIENVLGTQIDLNKQSLSILLSFYELISNFEFSNLRKKYIDDQPEFFLTVFLSSIDKNFDQPYQVLNKLSGHLAYMAKEVYQAICEALPLPSNLEASDKLKFAYANIYFAYYKLLKYSEKGKIEDKESKMKDAALISEHYFLSSSLKNDFERKRLLDLYIQSEDVEKAKQTLEDFENKEDPFILQNRCKVYRINEDFTQALEAINKALEQNDVAQAHKAAFLNDKAETLRLMEKQECIEVLDKAIGLQPNPKTKLHWSDKKVKWIEELK